MTQFFPPRTRDDLWLLFCINPSSTYICCKPFFSIPNYLLRLLCQNRLNLFRFLFALLSSKSIEIKSDYLVCSSRFGYYHINLIFVNCRNFWSKTIDFRFIIVVTYMHNLWNCYSNSPTLYQKPKHYPKSNKLEQPKCLDNPIKARHKLVYLVNVQPCCTVIL